MILRITPDDLRRYAQIAREYGRIRADSQAEDGGRIPDTYIPLVIRASGEIVLRWDDQDREYRLEMQDYDISRRGREGVVKVVITIAEAFIAARVVTLYTEITELTGHVPKDPVTSEEKIICYLHWWQDRQRFVAEFLDFDPGAVAGHE